MEPSVNLIWAFIAGLASFLSPCVLPLVPAYIGYMGGSTVMAARAAATVGGDSTVATSTARWVAVSHAVVFVLGLTLVLVLAFGGLTLALRMLFFESRIVLQWIAGVVLIILGIHMLGVINLPFLNYTRRLDLRPTSNLGYLRSFAIGVGFALGWTPCVGPILGGITAIALTGNTLQAFPLFIAYSLGLGVPFILAAMAMGQIASVLKKLTRRAYSLKIGNWKVIDQVNIVSLVSGALLVIMGVLIFTGTLAILAPAITWINI